MTASNDQFQAQDIPGAADVPAAAEGQEIAVAAAVAELAVAVVIVAAGAKNAVTVGIKNVIPNGKNGLFKYAVFPKP